MAACAEHRMRPSWRSLCPCTRFGRPCPILPTVPSFTIAVSVPLRYDARGKERIWSWGIVIAATPKRASGSAQKGVSSMRGTNQTDDYAALAARQWAAWRLTRRRLLQSGAFAGGALALGGLAATSRVRAAAAQEQPQPGGKVSMSLADQDVQSFDPIIPTDNMSIWTMLLIYDQLIRVGPDGKSMEPGLAEKWETTPDGLTWTFHLRDATFHDGSPVTAADAVYSLNRAVSSKQSQWGFIFSA